MTQFSLDGSTGSYPNIRKAIENGKAPIKSQVIIEQMLNYFLIHMKDQVIVRYKLMLNL